MPMASSVASIAGVAMYPVELRYPPLTVVLQTWSWLPSGQSLSVTCEADNSALVISISAPLAADRVRRSQAVRRRFGEREGKASPPLPSPTPLALPLEGSCKADTDHLSRSWAETGAWGGTGSWPDEPDREVLVRHIAELEAQFNASLQREAVLSSKIEVVRELLECSICFQPLCWPVSLRCGHTFCSACVAKWEKSAERSRKVVTCPICRAPAGSPMPTRALNDVCRAVQDEETAERRKEDEAVHQKYEVALRVRNRMEAQSQDVTRDELASLSFRSSASGRQALLTAPPGLRQSRFLAHTGTVPTESGSREFIARGLPSPTPTTVNTQADGAVNTQAHGADVVFAGLGSTRIRLQAPSASAANVRTEDGLLVHTPRSRADGLHSFV